MATPDRPRLADATLRHAVHVEGFKAHEAETFAPFLREIDRTIRERLTRDDLTAFTRERLEALLVEVDAMLAGVLERFTGQLLLDLREFAPVEAQATAAILSQAGVSVSLPAAEMVIAAAFTDPLAAGKGKLLEGFVRDWTQSERQAVTGAIRLGMVQGKTTAEIVRDIRGTKARKFADGLLAVTARNAETVVLTATAHVAASARASVYGANADILGGEQWDATLDHRTCPSCGALDRQVFDIGKGPQTPLHPRCRCVRIPVLSDEFAWLTEGEKRSSEHGAVEAESYYQWLKRQPPDYQDKALGPARAKLLREGGLSAEKFAALQLDRRWQPMTLDAMRKAEPELFARVFGEADTRRALARRQAVTVETRQGVVAFREGQIGRK